MNPLRQWRNEQKLRALDIAHRLEVSERTVLAWEHGAFRPSSDAYDQLASLMDLPVASLRKEWHSWLMEMKDDTSAWHNPSSPLPPSLGVREPV